MDTKLKKSKPSLVWLCFFLGVSIILSLAFLGISQAQDIYENFDDITAALRSDVKDMSSFKEEIASRFEGLLHALDDVDQHDESYLASFPSEGENLIYYAGNTKTGKTITNSDPGVILSGHPGSLPDGYDYYLYYDGSRFYVENAGKMIDVYRNDSGYPATGLNQFMQNGNRDYKDLRILLMVKKNIVRNSPAYSYFYQIKSNADMLKWMNIGFAILLLIGIILLVIAFFKRRIKREFDRKIAGVSGFLWFEVKIFLSVLAVDLLAWGGYEPGAFYYSYTTALGEIHFDSGTKDFTLICIFSVLCFWVFYIMLIDLIKSKKGFFKNNSINWLIKRYRMFESSKPFQKAMIWRIYALVAAEVLLGLLTGATVTRTNGAPFALLFIVIGVYLMYRYLRHYGKTVRDVGILLDRIDSLRNGKVLPQLSFNTDSDIYSAGECLDRIQEGFQKTVDERIKSERMKAELITNVSHDLKTPLTSIISYADLLSREEDLPEHVKDYIRILSQKSDHLKTLIQDLFDLSRASSGAIELEMEKIDLGKLIRQTLADMDEQISQSGLIFRVNIPDMPIMVLSDGKKLYRVFLNLLTNVFKYALEVSRVYINFTRSDDNKAVVEIKNISNYEMNFDAEEILERFVRGDKARSTEGSGLGLAIAKSFTTACGGSFDIKIDGDLFKVRLAFDIAE